MTWGTKSQETNGYINTDREGVTIESEDDGTIQDIVQSSC